jgi:hypothetical protein
LTVVEAYRLLVTVRAISFFLESFLSSVLVVVMIPGLKNDILEQGRRRELARGDMTNKGT